MHCIGSFDTWVGSCQGIFLRSNLAQARRRKNHGSCLETSNLSAPLVTSSIFLWMSIISASQVSVLSMSFGNTSFAKVLLIQDEFRLDESLSICVSSMTSINRRKYIVLSHFIRNAIVGVCRRLLNFMPLHVLLALMIFLKF
jgi:hypothetical protein